MATTTDRLKLILIAIFAIAQYTKADQKVVCYYDSKSHFRTGQGKFDLPFMEPALQFCTHLIYGYADINPETFKAVPLNEKFDVNNNNYRQVTDLKRRFPGLRVLLSVGGEDLTGQDQDKITAYCNMLESVDHRLTFINSAKELVKFYGFDGLDLAIKLPKTKPKKIHNSFKQFFINIKHSVVGESVVDDKADDHKEQYTALVRELRNNFRHDGLLLSLSFLPNVNSTVYADPRQLAPNIDFVTLNAYDFYTPARNPKEADFTAPLYPLHDRKFDENVDHQVRYWLQNGCPNNKIMLGISMVARTWKLDDDSGLTGVPPLHADGAGEAGPYTQQEGLLSYPEVCSKIATPTEIQAGYLGKLRKVNDPTRRFGTYAFKLPKDDASGIWVSFEDPDTVGSKASFAKAKGLGGVSIMDLSMDDFRGLCTGDKYPLLRAAKYRL